MELDRAAKRSAKADAAGQKAKDLAPITDESRPLTTGEMDQRARAAMQLSLDRTVSDHNTSSAARKEREQVRMNLLKEQEKEKSRVNWYSALLDKQFWEEDIPRSARTTGGNFAAMTAGFPSDIVQLLASAGTLPLAPEPSSLEERQPDLFAEYSDPRLVGIPYTADTLIEPFGGSEEHLSYWPSAVLAPGPGELMPLAKGIGVGAIGLASNRVRMSKLEDFISSGGLTKGAYDQDLYTKTGWYADANGQPHFWINDGDATVKLDIIRSKLDQTMEMVEGTARGKPQRITVKMGEVLDHEELWEIYPQIKNMALTIHAIPDGNGGFRIFKPNREAAKGMELVEEGATKAQVEMAGRDTANRVEVFYAKNDDELKKHILHEAQHVIQVIEGWARGTNTERMTNEVIESFINARNHKEVIKIIDDGIDNVDDLHKALVEKNFTTQEIDYVMNGDPETLGGSDSMNYLMAKLDEDFDELNRLSYHANLSIDMYGTDIVHLLHYLGLNASDKADILSHGLGYALTFEDMERLKFRAYQNSLGEAEARLTQGLRANRNVTDVPDPNQLDEVQQPLSPGRAERPGMVTPSELADIPLADIEISSTASRALDMEKGYNIVKVPVSGGRLGNAKVDILKNPSRQEVLQLAKERGTGAFRTFRTEDGDLFVWDGMSEALHADMERYLGIKTTGKDWSDRASVSDVREMIAGNWYGNEF